MKLDFEYIEQALLDYNAKSEYKQASIIMLRNIFKEAETKQCDIHVVSNRRELLTAFLRYGKQRHYTPLTEEQIEALVNDFEGSL